MAFSGIQTTYEYIVDEPFDFFLTSSMHTSIEQSLLGGRLILVFNFISYPPSAQPRRGVSKALKPKKDFCTRPSC